jgi:hypothetical protein
MVSRSSQADAISVGTATLAAVIPGELKVNGASRTTRALIVLWIADRSLRERRE